MNRIPFRAGFRARKEESRRSLRAVFFAILIAINLVLSFGAIPAWAGSCSHGQIHDTGILQTDYAISDADYEAFLSMYLALPESLRCEFASRGWKILFTKKAVKQCTDDMYDLFAAEHPGVYFERYALPWNTSSYSWTGSDTIYVMKQYTDRVAKERIRRAMYHEMGHAADNIVENIMIEHGLADPLLSHSSYTAGDPDFTRIFASEAAADQDDYAKIDTDEYFACSFSQYLTGNDPRMEDLQSVTYGYVTGILNIIEQDWNEEAARDENFH